MTTYTPAVHRMFLLEMAADNWFSRLGKKEQQAYLKAHPKSKFGHGGEGADTTSSKHHAGLERYHRQKAGETTGSESEAHAHAADLHGQAKKAPGSRASARANVATRNAVKAGRVGRQSPYDVPGPALPRAPAAKTSRKAAPTPAAKTTRSGFAADRDGTDERPYKNLKDVVTHHFGKGHYNDDNEVVGPNGNTVATLHKSKKSDHHIAVKHRGGNVEHVRVKSAPSWGRRNDEG